MKRSKKRDKLRSLMDEKAEEYRQKQLKLFVARKVKSGPIIELPKPKPIETEKSIESEDEISAMSERKMFEKYFFGKG